jgi:hypothetical protein
MMVDLSLLTSNLKSCSYVRKGPRPERAVRRKLPMPRQDVIKLSNVPAKVLVTTGGANRNDNNMVVGLTKEPFGNILGQNWLDSFYVKLVVLLLILYIVMKKD